jgi:hypothetical protein
MRQEAVGNQLVAQFLELDVFRQVWVGLAVQLCQLSK